MILTLGRMVDKRGLEGKLISLLETVALGHPVVLNAFVDITSTSRYSESRGVQHVLFSRVLRILRNTTPQQDLYNNRLGGLMSSYNAVIEDAGALMAMDGITERLGETAVCVFYALRDRFEIARMVEVV